MNESPFISVCIPAYEREMHLQRLLHSIAKQSYKNYEVIISDDSKSSAVKELVARFAEKFTIHYSQNIPSAGSPQNWNVSIGKARGNWIKLMHDDDWFATSDALEQFARCRKYLLI
jgi:glycosyltransferase involved in cell wall biosynthesis